MSMHIGVGHHNIIPPTTATPIASCAVVVRVLRKVAAHSAPIILAESAHSIIQYKLPANSAGLKIQGRKAFATPRSDFEIPRKYCITDGSTRAFGTASSRTYAGGVGSDEDAKKVIWQYDCCFSLQTVLIAISRTHTAKRSENPRMRRRRRALGAVNPVRTKGIIDDRRRNVIM